MLFSLLTWQVVADGPLRGADERLGRAASGSLSGPVAEFFADLGNVMVAVPVLALAVGYAALRDRGRAVPRWWLPPLAAALAMAAVPAFVAPLKSLIARPGPPAAGLGGFYPSGHAATAAVAYGAAAVLLLPSLRAAVARRLLVAGVLLLNAAVGAGLVAQGYHWPLDVAGSWLLCALLGTLVSLGLTPGAAGRSVRRGPASATPPGSADEGPTR